MKTMREHLAESHISAGEFHTACAKCHTDIAGHHAAMSKHLETSDGTASALHKSLAEQHTAIATHHITAGEFHANCAKEMDKAANALIPTKASVVPTQDTPAGAYAKITGDNPWSGTTVRAVPRPGAPGADRNAPTLPTELDEVLGGPIA